MDQRLETVDKMLAEHEQDSRLTQSGKDYVERELAFAIMAVDVNDPATLNWLATCAVMRASHLPVSA